MEKGLFWVGATTLVLITITIVAAMNLPFNWILFLTIIGQVMVIFMVYNVLTDTYSTTKTFADFYEDHPIGNEENFR